MARRITKLLIRPRVRKARIRSFAGLLLWLSCYWSGQGEAYDEAIHRHSRN